ncbi:zygote arrest protein 1-like [Branchiostoma lanceolatum]|uniref:zygote arrest protein 1-like n=1 Tax=Branchiostoma lanceolatum TaxID=7740 RepID=UPI003452B2EC
MDSKDRSITTSVFGSVVEAAMPERGTQFPLPEKGVQTPAHWPPPAPKSVVLWGTRYKHPQRPTLRVSALSPVQECSETEARDETPGRAGGGRRRRRRRRNSAAERGPNEQSQEKTRPRRRKEKPDLQAPLDETYETVPFDETYSVASESGTEQFGTTVGDEENVKEAKAPSTDHQVERSMPKPQRTRTRRARQKKGEDTAENLEDGMKDTKVKEEARREETPTASPEDVKGVVGDTARTERSGRRLFSESSTGSTEHQDDCTSQDEDASGENKKSRKDRKRLFFEQKYGYFHCHSCDWRWESAYVWCVAGTDKVYFKQDCRLCQNAINPYFVEGLYCGRCHGSPCKCPQRPRADMTMQYNQGESNARKLHRRELCHRCRDKPIPCNAIPSFKYQV